MMNKSKIDWCDFSWNPVTGCRHSCEYCYARKQVRRFSGDIRLNRGNKQLQFDAPRNLYTLKDPFKNEIGRVLPFPAGFEPTLHEYRLPMPAQKKKPANIFVCSMADLFGEWVPDEWIRRVFEACEAAPWHNYLFLTKNPQRYQELWEANLLPKLPNFWYGSTATTPKTSVFFANGYNTFVSIEPIAEDFGAGGYTDAKWIIVGAETGNRSGKIKPRRAWIENIVKVAHEYETPILIKDSTEMRDVWGDELIQEFPESLKHPADAPIPHCKECEYCTREPQGDRGEKYICERIREAEGRHILGRYTRTSPPWCPKRKEEKE